MLVPIDINAIYSTQVKLNDGIHEIMIPLSNICEYSVKVRKDYTQGNSIKEIKINSVSDQTFEILVQKLLYRREIHDCSEEILHELFHIGLELEINDFVERYCSKIDTKNISINTIPEYLKFIKKSYDLIETPNHKINLNEFLENIINFIGTNILDIEINKLIEFCKVGVSQLYDNQNFIDRIISRCEQLGYFEKETHIDHIYDFLIELINDSSYFGYLILKLDPEKIKSTLMESLLNLVFNDEYSQYHKDILDIQKKFINIIDGNPKAIKTQITQLQSYISIVCDIIQSKQIREVSIQKFLEIFQIQNKFESIYDFLHQRAEVKDNYTINVACAIGLSEVVDDQQNTILLSACLKNDFILVEFLVKNKCNIKAKNINKDDPILCTSISGSSKMFDFLVKNNLDAHISNEITGRNAILTACKSGNFEIIKYLVSQGISLSCSDKEKQNCIFFAVSSGNWDIIDYLI